MDAFEFKKKDLDERKLFTRISFYFSVLPCVNLHAKLDIDHA